MIFVFEKRVLHVQVGGNGVESSIPFFTLMTQFSIYFISASKERQKCTFKFQEMLKCNFFPAFAIVAHPRGNCIKNDHDHSQTAGPGKTSTVMSTCSFITRRKLKFLPLVSESSPALRNFWLRISCCVVNF